MQALKRPIILPRGDFRAFLCYSHVDSRVARWLHRGLETYRLPRAVALAGPDGTKITKLGQIFRDRDDFPAATDLSEAVRKALARSHALIVLGSPDAKASIWVAQEIQLFASMYPDRPILAVLLRGTPQESFPMQLVAGREPLAADMRPGMDGRRLSLLKVVAGLLDLPLDALVQRDAQRNVRRVTAVTLASFALLLVMAVMTITALNASREATRQRAEAEGLIEYMLTDLRPELRRVGRLDVMKDVNERAMRFYQDQGALTALSGDSLMRRARVMHAMGEDENNQGEVDSARRLFGDAYGATQEQLRRAPHDGERIFAHAQSAYWLGYMGYRQADWATAARYWEEYRQLAEQLIATDERDRRSLIESGYAEGNLCTLALARPQTARAALSHCTAALSFMQEAVRRFGQDVAMRSALANRREWLADAMIAQGDIAGGLAQRRLQESELRALVKANPRDMVLLDQWMRALMVLSEDLRDHGRLAEARPFHDEAARIAAQLTAEDPSNGIWRGWAERIEEF